MRFPRIVDAVVSVVLLTWMCSSVLANDWPQWRGPNRDGVWKETGLLDKFPDAQIKLRWRTPISSGYSGPTVAGGRVYVTDRPRVFQRPLWASPYPPSKSRARRRLDSRQSRIQAAAPQSILANICSMTRAPASVRATSSGVFPSSSARVGSAPRSSSGCTSALNPMPAA